MNGPWQQLRWGKWARAGVWSQGDDIRTVPLSFNVTVELVQLVGQVQVVNRVVEGLFFVTWVEEVPPADRLGSCTV